jgi:tetratricopeptide (TPR) repeat protein
MPYPLPRVCASALFVCTFAMAQPATDADLFGAAARENDPVKKLALLDQWSAKFPETAFRQQRNLQYISSYSTLTATAVKTNAVTEGQNAAQTMIQKADELFAPGVMPSSVKDADWAAARRDFLLQAHGALATFALKVRDYPAAEEQFTALLDMNHQDAASSYNLGTAIIAERDPQKYPEAIFHMARAVTIAAPGTFDATTRKSMEGNLESVYTTYHGGLDGLDDVKKAASQSWMPPAGWTIQSIAAIRQEQLDAATREAREHPELVVWRTLKELLMAPEGAAYFASEMKGAEIANLKGTVSKQPNAKTLVLEMDGSQGGEATLRFDVALKGKIPVGSLIDYTGVPLAFATSPFGITFEVEKKKVNGLGAH